MSASLAAVILAAGKGTRMRSNLHKVLHPIGGKPMLHHLLSSVESLKAGKTVLVLGAGKDQVEASLAAENMAQTIIAEQKEQLGTGHACKMAQDALSTFDGNVIILYGDVPLIPVDVMREMLDTKEQDGAALVTLGFAPEDPAKYGRLVVAQDGTLARIVEYKDASDEERAITLCNSGMMVVGAEHLFRWLDQLKSDNAAGEYYLTDIVDLARGEGLRSSVVVAGEKDVLGVNDRVDLARAEAAFQDRERKKHQLAGVTLIDPSTVFFSADTVVCPDVTIEPHVVIGPGTTIASGARIKAFSHLEGAQIGPDAQIGPYARLRPGTEIAAGVKIGNFVETKKAKLDSGAKVSHLSYIGDAHVGEDANIGAGTITCNYDGFLKYQTNIGAGAFIGSNSALVAPVTIGDGAIVGAGSVITKDVSRDGLATTRAPQRERTGLAATFRSRKAAEKKKKHGG